MESLSDWVQELGCETKNSWINDRIEAMKSYKLFIAEGSGEVAPNIEDRTNEHQIQQTNTHWETLDEIYMYINNVPRPIQRSKIRPFSNSRERRARGVRQGEEG